MGTKMIQLEISFKLVYKENICSFCKKHDIDIECHKKINNHLIKYNFNGQIDDIDKLYKFFNT